MEANVSQVMSELTAVSFGCNATVSVSGLHSAIMAKSVVQLLQKLQFNL